MSAHHTAVRAIVLCTSSLALFLSPAHGAAADQATPETRSCDGAITQHHADGTPSGSEIYVSAMPSVGSGTTVDQWYIEMMIPHHQSIIAMAQAALPRLNDDRLLTIAEAIVETQQEEIDRLEAIHAMVRADDPSRTPEMTAPAASQSPHLAQDQESMGDSALLMNAGALVAEFCARPNPDVAFIALTIPHHQMAIDASMLVLAEGTDPQIKEIARNVIAAQKREIEELTAIGTGSVPFATPVSTEKPSKRVA